MKIVTLYCGYLCKVYAAQVKSDLPFDRHAANVTAKGSKLVPHEFLFSFEKKNRTEKKETESKNPPQPPTIHDTLLHVVNRLLLYK